jgi:hypothetical protein
VFCGPCLKLQYLDDVATATGRECNRIGVCLCEALSAINYMRSDVHFAAAFVIGKGMESDKPISIRLDTIDQLVEPCPPSPFRRRRLREEAEKFLVERVTALPSRTAAKLLIVLQESEAPQAGVVVDAIHEHFNFLRVETEAKLKRMRRFGWRSFAVAIAFLAVAITIVHLMKRYLPSGTLSSVAIEGLTILAWIALWRPGELLLYERYPFQRDARLFRKLEQCEVQFSYTNR